MEAGRERVALMVAGGGTGGAIEIGAIQSLLERRPLCTVDLVHGLSFGAYVCGVFAFKPPDQTDLDAIKHARKILVESVSTPCIFGVPNPFSLCFAPSMLSLDGVSDIVNTHFLNKNYRRDVHCTTWDVDLQRGMFVSQSNMDPTVDADTFKKGIRSSSSIPFVFETTERHKTPHVDGGCLHMVPNVLPPGFADRSWDYFVILLCNSWHVPPLESDLGSGAAVLSRAMSVNLCDRARHDVEQLVAQVRACDEHKQATTKIFIIYPDQHIPHPINGTTADSLELMFEVGEQLMEKALSESPLGNVESTWIGRRDAAVRNISLALPPPAPALPPASASLWF